MAEQPQLTPEEVRFFKRVIWHDQEDGKLRMSTGDKTVTYEGQEAERMWRLWQWYRRNQMKL